MLPLALFCHLQFPVTECDLLVDLGLIERGPVRLATLPPPVTDPLPGFRAIMDQQPFLSLSSRTSSSEVFVVDGVVVIFVGYSSGQVRKVSTAVCVREIGVYDVHSFTYCI